MKKFILLFSLICTISSCTNQSTDDVSLEAADTLIDNKQKEISARNLTDTLYCEYVCKTEYGYDYAYKVKWSNSNGSKVKWNNINGSGFFSSENNYIWEVRKELSNRVEFLNLGLEDNQRIKYAYINRILYDVNEECGLILHVYHWWQYLNPEAWPFKDIPLHRLLTPVLTIWIIL